jgi:hypothetical protein
MLITWKSKIYSSNIFQLIGVIWLQKVDLIKVLELSWAHKVGSSEVGRIKKCLGNEPV